MVDLLFWKHLIHNKKVIQAVFMVCSVNVLMSNVLRVSFQATFDIHGLGLLVT